MKRRNNETVVLGGRLLSNPSPAARKDVAGLVRGLGRKKWLRAQFTGPVLLLSVTFGVSAAAGAPPQITVSPQPPTGWLRDGEYSISATAVSDTEILGFKWTIGDPGYAGMSMLLCLRHGCPLSNPITYVIRPAALPDGVLRLSAVALYKSQPVNQVGTFETARRTVDVRVDRSAPVAPNAELIGGDAWRARNQFAARWTPMQDVGSPLVAAVYRLCPAANPIGDVTGCITGERHGSVLRSIDDISVPASGAWRLQIALKDAMGHVDLEAGALVDELRLDLEAPRLTFVPRDPADPARVRLNVSDEHSGVALVEIEARRHGEALWRTLSVSPRGGHLTALLDDSSLPAGEYEIRGRGVDAVGNERTLSNADSIQLPVRQGTKLSAGMSKRTGRKGRSVLDRSPSVRFGARVPIHGRVTDAFGKGRANVSVEVSERLALPGVAWRRLQTVETDDDGGFTYTAPKGVARTIKFQYAGSPTARAAATEVSLQVRAGSTLKPSRRKLRNGDTVVLRGRLLGRPWPSTGKIVTVQAWTSRGWVTFGNARARAKNGRWSYRYRFTGTTTTSRYRFRAVIPREESYPYAPGTTPVKAVVVRGADG